MTNEASIYDMILKLVQRTSPETVNELLVQMERELKIPQEKALEYISTLEDEGRLKLTSKPKKAPREFNDYLRSSYALWFWITIILALATTISVFTIPEKAYPLIYIRYIFGIIFIGFLPGYSLIKTLFPTKEIDNIERFALSIGTSLAIVPLVGLLLNYTTWGIRITPITLSILLLTVILSTTGLIREHQEKSNLAHTQ